MIGTFYQQNRIPIGTTLRVYCPSKGVYHFGIASFNNTVIDLAPRNGIAKRTWFEFSEGEIVEIVPKENDDLPENIVHERATSLIGKWEYDVLNSNCEQFVNFCKKGSFKSDQLERVGEYALAGGIFLGLVCIANKIFSNEKI